MFVSSMTHSKRKVRYQALYALTRENLSSFICKGFHESEYAINFYIYLFINQIIYHFNIIGRYNFLYGHTCSFLDGNLNCITSISLIFISMSFLSSTQVKIHCLRLSTSYIVAIDFRQYGISSRKL